MLSLNRLVIALASATAVMVICLWVITVRHAENTGLDDIRTALWILKAVQAAENTCYERRGEYSELQALGGDCANIDRKLLTGRHDGFNIVVRSTGRKYSVTILPQDDKRFRSVYSDESGVVRLGTRQYPASANSPPSYVPTVPSRSF